MKTMQELYGETEKSEELKKALAGAEEPAAFVKERRATAGLELADEALTGVSGGVGNTNEPHEYSEEKFHEGLFGFINDQALAQGPDRYRNP